MYWVCHKSAVVDIDFWHFMVASGNDILRCILGVKRKEMVK
jgi:hypothetical protein